MIALPWPHWPALAFRSCPALLVICLLATPVAFCGSGPARAGAPAVRGRIPRPRDEIWLISTRQSGYSVPTAAVIANLRYYRFDPSTCSGPGQWQLVDREAFLGHDLPGRSTVFFVHGNRVSRCESFRRGMAVYQSLARHTRSDSPVRFVIWSWPTARLRGLAKDVRVKAQRTGLAGCQLAWLVDQIGSETSIGMVGFSFGARVVTGALHVLGGGRLGQFSLPVRRETRGGAIRTVLMTAALDDDWLLPGHRHGLALSQVDHMLLMNNSCDRAMKWYPLIDRCRRPTALGRWGMPSLCMLGPDARKIDQCDVCHRLGHVHDFHGFLFCSNLMQQTWEYISFEPLLAGNVHDMTDRSVE
jgi:hypothetical protein